jgi:plastocyanin
MAFDFPNSPSTGSTHSTSGAIYVYDGEKWVVSTSFTGTINIEDEIPAGTISSSAQIEAVITDAYISSSVSSSNIGFDGNYNNLSNIPLGVVTSSDDRTVSVVTNSNSGGSIFKVSGSNGEILSVIDSNSGNLLEITNHSGTTVFTVDSSGAVSSSQAISASAFSGDGSQLTGISGGGSTPAGTISGSAQITALGFVSESGVNTSVNSFTESIQSEVDSLTAATSSYLTSLPSGVISGSAQIDRTWTLGADGSSHYTFTGPGLTGTENDPTLYLTRGETYRFVNEMGAHPFRIQSDPNGSTGTQYNDGVTNNDVSNGTLIIDVQFDAPSRIYYQCTSHPNMGGVIEILEQLPSGLVSGSSQIADLGYVSSSTVDTIQVMTSASYSGITPVSGTLYIIQG